MENPESWFKFIEGSGLAIVLIFMGTIALWRIMTWSGTNVVKPMVSSHTGLVEQLKMSTEKHVEALERMNENQSEIVNTQKVIVGTQQDIVTLLKRSSGP